MVGASDGKFVIPLAASGYYVVAIERNAAALDGGVVELPGGTRGRMQGLRRRLVVEGLSHQVKIFEGDILTLQDIPKCDAVWTSCSWHYSVNHGRPLGNFIQRMQSLCKVSGLFGAEYMMPVEPRHHEIEHYLEEGEIRRYMADWRILWETYTPPFVEPPHVEQLAPHVHRMGLVVAERQKQDR